MRTHWLDGVTADQLRLLDKAINYYFTHDGKPESRLDEIENQFEIDLFRLKVRLEQVYEVFSETGKLPFNPKLDVEDKEFREFCAVTDYRLYGTFIIGPPRDEEKKFDWFVA